VSRTKAVVAVLVAVTAFYAWMIGAKGIALLRNGGLVPILLGVALLLLPVLGLYLVWRELDFGRRSARLADELAREDALPLDDLPRRPSGRVDRVAADQTFAARRAEVEADPESWQAWYRLALAYDDAGDRTRARSAARKAIALHARRTP
jgi:hypothetical protein